jgi:hypothetical protein
MRVLSFVPMALSLVLTACSDGSGPDGSGNSAVMPVIGFGQVSDRITAEISVRGDIAYTSTWGGLGDPVGDVLKVWNIAGPTPVLLNTVTVSNARTLGDVQALVDPALMVVATEYTGGSIVVYSLTDPANPVELSRFSSPNTMPGVHTAEVATVGGQLYAFLSVDPGQSFAARLVIVDLSTPTAPVEVTSIQMGSPYVHDVFVRDGILFTALWNDGLKIWDVGGGGKGGTVAAPVSIGSVHTFGGHVHNVAWFHDPATNSKRYAFVGEEVGGSVGASSEGDIHVVDVGDLANPREVAFFNVPGAGTHNFSLDEAQGILYAAYYNGGVRAVDIRGDLGGCARGDKDLTGRCDLRRMGREMAHGLVDTPNRFVWGVQWVGNFVYASDMANGLWKLAAVQR